MNALPNLDADSARRREDVLRELNLYPLWQLRKPVVVNAAEAEAVPLATHGPVVENVVQAAARAPLQSGMPAGDITDLGWPGLKQRVQECNACELRAGCMRTVFGAGDENADWLFVGSWPTEDDEAGGEVFAGQAGQLLDNMLAAIKLKRGSNVYLANVVKCCGAIRRGPQAGQIAQCAPYLARQIALIRPKLIVVLGHAAATALLGEDSEWNSLLGKVHEFRGYANNSSSVAIPLIITHHPAALLLTPLNKAQTWRDLCLARDTMRRLITDELS